MQANYIATVSLKLVFSFNYLKFRFFVSKIDMIITAPLCIVTRMYNMAHL